MSHLGIGLHYDVPAAVYHSDPCELPSLSSSVLRTLLTKSIEHAALEHAKLGGQVGKSTAAMGLGSIVHALLAGESSDLVVGQFDSYKTGEARKWRDSVIAERKTPVLERDLADARPVVAAIREKVALGCSNTPFRDSAGKSEVSAIWQEDGIYCRARYDRLVLDPNGYADIWDWKTTTDVSARAIEKAIIKYGYHIQAAFYLRGLTSVLPQYLGRTSFIFAFVESAPPYAVRRVTLSSAFLAKGMKEVNAGIERWRHAMRTGDFTAHNTETLEVDLPAFMEDDDEITAS